MKQLKKQELIDAHDREITFLKKLCDSYQDENAHLASQIISYKLALVRLDIENERLYNSLQSAHERLKTAEATKAPS